MSNRRRLRPGLVEPVAVLDDGLDDDDDYADDDECLCADCGTPTFSLEVGVDVEASRTAERNCLKCGRTFRGTHSQCSSCQRTERACDGCGRMFTSTGRRCRACQQVKRDCEKCGKTFKGDMARCSSCRSADRTCAGCGKTFKSSGNLRCKTCQGRERACIRCGRTFTGTSRQCAACWRSGRTCEKCGKTFKGHTRSCNACRETERECGSCGRVFKGHTLRCAACRSKKRICTECGKTFKSSGNLRCDACQKTERTCEECGRTFTSTSRRCSACWRKSLAPGTWKARKASYVNVRRARKRGAEVAGPVPPEVYEAIRASGPCVYCGALATTVDHVLALDRGGWEHESNLVPACGTCNSSKWNRLLTEWYRTDLVAYGVEHSPKVAAEWARLTGLGTRAPVPGLLAPSHQGASA